MTTKDNHQTHGRASLKIGLLLILLLLPFCYSVTYQRSNMSQNTSLEPSSTNSNSPRGAIRQASQASQTDRVIVILAELADAPNSTSVSQINSTVFQKLASYYDQVSYHLLSIVGNITGWISMPNTTVQYGLDSNGIDPNSWWLIRDVVNMTENSINFAAYDTVIVVHSGRDQANSGISNDIWSCYYSGLEIPTNDGVTITTGIIVSETDPLGIYAHEFGHSLGLPDLYNTNGNPEFVGDWDVMAQGSWLPSNTGTSPSELTSWSRLQLGWITDGSLLVGRSVQGVVDRLEIKGTNFTAIKIPLTTDTYYLVEVRQKILYDSYLPASGVLVLYVDETLGSGEGIVKVKYSQSLTAATYTADPGNNKYIDDGNNVNITVLSAYSTSYKVSVGLIVPDKTPPNINLVGPVAWSLSTTQPGSVSAIITDTGFDSSGVKNATIFYSSDQGGTWKSISMVPSTGNKYSAIIPPQNASLVEYYIEAYDYAGNLAIANNSGHYFMYGYSSSTLLVAGMAIAIVAFICVAVAISSMRKDRKK